MSQLRKSQAREQNERNPNLSIGNVRLQRFKYSRSMDIRSLLKANNDNLLKLYKENLDITVALQRTLIREVLPHIRDELQLEENAVDWANEWLQDTGEFDIGSQSRLILDILYSVYFSVSEGMFALSLIIWCQAVDWHGSVINSRGRSPWNQSDKTSSGA